MKFSMNDGSSFEIPAGYKVVTTGAVREGDLLWDSEDKEFQRSDRYNGDPVREFYCVIRWSGTGSRVEDAIHVLSDEECRRMLSEIWHCFYLPDGSPVPDDDVIASEVHDILKRIKLNGDHS